MDGGGRRGRRNLEVDHRCGGGLEGLEEFSDRGTSDPDPVRDGPTIKLYISDVDISPMGWGFRSRVRTRLSVSEVSGPGSTFVNEVRVLLSGLGTREPCRKDRKECWGSRDHPFDSESPQFPEGRPTTGRGPDHSGSCPSTSPSPPDPRSSCCTLGPLRREGTRRFSPRPPRQP